MGVEGPINEVGTKVVANVDMSVVDLHNQSVYARQQPSTAQVGGIGLLGGTLGVKQDLVRIRLARNVRATPYVGLEAGPFAAFVQGTNTQQSAPSGLGAIASTGIRFMPEKDFQSAAPGGIAKVGGQLDVKRLMLDQDTGLNRTFLGASVVVEVK